jgi:hypothetical protein
MFMKSKLSMDDMMQIDKNKIEYYLWDMERGIKLNIQGIVDIYEAKIAELEQIIENLRRLDQ